MTKHAAFNYDPSQPRDDRGRFGSGGGYPSASDPDIVDAIARAEDEFFEHVAVRVVEEDASGFSVGDVLPPSRVWDDGVATDETLSGTSGIDAGKGKLAKALDLSKQYTGKTMLIIGGDRGDAGEDAGEVIIKDAVVVGVIRLSEKVGNKGRGKKHARINVSTAVNASKIRRERRDGRDVVIVPSATLPDGVVMNRVRYGAAAIEKGFGSLDGTPAPLGHPTINGNFVSASDPRGMVRGFVGAWNENVRRENGRVLIDKVIDVEFANQLEGGRTVLEAIENGEPIHTSTGLYAIMNELTNDAEADFEATDLVFDHDAILIGEVGAATPEQGVGMLVNKAVSKDGKEIMLINSAYEDAERELDWAAEAALRAAERIDRLPLLERIKSAIRDAIRGATERDPSLNEKETAMPVNDEQFKALSEKVDTLSDGFKGLGDQITNAVTAAVAPLVEAQTALANAAKAKDNAELTELRGKIVSANLMDEAAAGELTLNAARALAPKATPGKAFGLMNGLGKTDTRAAFKAPKAED